MHSLGIVSDEIDRDPERALAIASALGIAHVEFRFFRSGRVPGVDPSELEHALAACKHHGVRVTGISPGIYKYVRSIEAARDELAARFRPSVELARRLELNSIVVFGPCKPDATDTDGPAHSSADPPDWVLRALHELADAARDCGVRALIEPEPLSYTDTAAATAELLHRVGREELGVNYDPGNIAWSEGGDPRDGVALLAPFIANVHVKNLLDAPRSAAPSWSPADRGIIDYEHQFRELRRIGYKGPISLEPHMQPTPPVIATCARAALRLIERAAEQATDDTGTKSG
jgi:sugar phosphate isomerase/epimerase